MFDIQAMQARVNAMMYARFLFFLGWAPVTVCGAVLVHHGVSVINLEAFPLVTTDIIAWVSALVFGILAVGVSTIRLVLFGRRTLGPAGHGQVYVPK